MPAPVSPKSLLEEFRPTTLAEVVGQPALVDQLQSFVAAPYETVFCFHGPTGVGKSCTAKALGYDVGCTRDFEDMGGINELPSGQQDGAAVRELIRRLAVRPMYGSGWKVAIINEADCMTPQAEAIWLDGLEHLPPKTIIVFTTNALHKLTRRLVGRCEVVQFDGASPEFLRGLHAHIRKIWKAKTGKRLDRIPVGLGRYEMADTVYSVRLAVQQIAPLIRTGAAGAAPPAKVQVPFIRSTEVIEHEKWQAAGHKAAETRRRNLAAS